MVKLPRPPRKRHLVVSSEAVGLVSTRARLHCSARGWDAPCTCGANRASPVALQKVDVRYGQRPPGAVTHHIDDPLDLLPGVEKRLRSVSATASPLAPSAPT